jgi:hypothetical protein
LTQSGGQAGVLVLQGRPGPTATSLRKVHSCPLRTGFGAQDKAKKLATFLPYDPKVCRGIRPSRWRHRLKIEINVLFLKLDFKMKEGRKYLMEKTNFNLRFCNTVFFEDTTRFTFRFSMFVALSRDIKSNIMGSM